MPHIKKKIIRIRCVKSKGFYCGLFWLKLHLNGNMALALVGKLSKQRAYLKLYYHFASIPCYMALLQLLLNLPHALLLCSTNWSDVMEDVSLLFRKSSKHLRSNTTFFQLMYMYLRTLVGVIRYNRIISRFSDIKDNCL